MEYLLYVLLFALAAALLYIWGLRRSRDQQKTMEAMLAGKCEKRIRKHLRQNGSVTAEEAAVWQTARPCACFTAESG